MTSPARKTNTRKPENTSTEATSAAKDAYERIRPRLLQMTADSIGRPYANVRHAAATALGASASIVQLRDELAKELPGFPLQLVDELEDLANAAVWADYLATEAGGEDLPDMMEKAIEVRRTFTMAAKALAFADLLDGAKVNAFTAGRSSSAIAYDVFHLSALVSDNWSAITDKTWLTRAQVDEAQAFAHRLIAAIALAEGPSRAADGEVDPVDMRARAFSLLTKTYDKIRRAIVYLRWDRGDANRWAPTLVRRKRKAKPKVATAAPAAPSPEATPPSVETPPGDAIADAVESRTPSPLAPPAVPPTVATPTPEVTGEMPEVPASMPPRSNGSTGPARSSLPTTS